MHPRHQENYVPWHVTSDAEASRSFQITSRMLQACGDHPMRLAGAGLYAHFMNPLLLILIIILLFGGGGFYFGGPAIGGGGIGFVLLVVLIIYLMGGMRSGD
jgi:hypothetical protein